MKNTALIAAGLSAVFLLITCAAPAHTGGSAPAEGNNKGAGGNNLFAVNLFKQLSAAQGNIFLSPYSIRTALAMTYAGARGETASQMENALAFASEGENLHAAFAESIDRLNSTAGCSYEMNIANSLWIDTTRTFLQPFIETNKRYYNAGIEQVDFMHDPESARTKINTWVETQTRQKIKDLIPPRGVSTETRLALVNAVYFKGRWDQAFDKELSRSAPFYCADGSTVEAELMTFSRAENLPFFAGDGFRVLELGYMGDSVSMVVVLPDKAGGLAAIEELLDEKLLSAWIAAMRTRPVNVFLPRFSITWGAENIVPHLRALGMRDAFVKGAADFSGIDGTRELLITGAFHKAFVDVNEEGTEAAATTGVVVGVTSLPPEPEVFRADHPFLFLIREKKSGDILFMGRMAQPADN